MLVKFLKFLIEANLKISLTWFKIENTKQYNLTHKNTHKPELLTMMLNYIILSLVVQMSRVFIKKYY